MSLANKYANIVIDNLVFLSYAYNVWIIWNCANMLQPI